MALIVADRVQETSTTTGTGPLTLLGAVTGYRAASAVCVNGDTFTYYAEAIDANERPTGAWETGLGTWGTGNILTRTTIYASSNTGAAVSWAAGTKRIGLGLVSNAALGPIRTSSIAIDSNATSYAVSTTTTAITQIALVSFAAATYGSGEVIIQATQGTIRQISKLLVVHNGTIADATEYGSIQTGVKLFTAEVDINSGNVRVLITPTSATSTVYKASYTLIGA